MRDGQPNSPDAIRAAWDSLADSYAEMISDPSKRGLAAEIELAAFERALPAGRQLDILDAGCGVGFHGCRLLTKGHHVTFADISPVMLQKARAAAAGIGAAGACFFQEIDVRKMHCFPDGSFDAIVSGGTVVSDCGDPTAAVAEFGRVLRSGGVAGISLRNGDGPQQTGGRRELIPNGGRGFDWWFFSPESARELCRRTGLAVTRMCPVLMKPPDTEHPAEYVREHLDARDMDRWRRQAWELFVIARRVAAR